MSPAPRCRVCGGRELELFLDLGKQPHCDSLLRPRDLAKREPRYPLQAYFCSSCTTVQLGYTVPKEVMFSEYLYVSGTTEALRSHFRASAERLIRRLGLKAGDLVVDIGSNDGTWLSMFQARGLRVLGVESAGNLAAVAAKAGIPTLNRFFNAAVAADIVKKHGYPKLVTAAGVFFHLEELHSATEGIAALCGGGAAFCVQAIYLGEIVRHTQFDQFYHEHLTYWSLRSLSTLLLRHGLRPFAVAPLAIHGGSIEVLAAREGLRPVEASVGKLLASERRRRLGQLGTYRKFAKRVFKIERELKAILRRYAEAGKTVQAFGAPAKGGTLLNTFGLDAAAIPCAVERNPLKMGLLIPGARIPIVDEAKTPPPDAYLVLAWNFLGEFLRKKKDYIMGGGEFIVPIPRPVVIGRNNYREFTV